MEMSNHEKYLAGIPLSAELQEVRVGVAAVAEKPPAPQSEVFRDIERDLTRAERLGLKELRQSAGWAVLQRALEKKFQIQKRYAIAISQHDPLGHAKEISEAWAYVITFHRSTQEIELIVNEEIAKLDTGGK